MEEADRHRLGRVASRSARATRAGLRPVERDQHLAPRVAALRRTSKTRVARAAPAASGSKKQVVAVVLDARLAADAQQIAEARGRHERDARAAVLDHGVGRERRAVDDALDLDAGATPSSRSTRATADEHARARARRAS